jgi:hypothetical protein
MDLNKTGLTLACDKLNVSGGFLQLGGLLSVSLTGDSLVAGDAFTLFSAGTYSGSFNTYNLPDLSASGLSWDTSALGSTGVLSVAAVPEPNTWLLTACGMGSLVSMSRVRRRPQGE